MAAPWRSPAMSGRQGSRGLQDRSEPHARPGTRISPPGPVRSSRSSAWRLVKPAWLLARICMRYTRTRRVHMDSVPVCWTSPPPGFTATPFTEKHRGLTGSRHRERGVPYLEWRRLELLSRRIGRTRDASSSGVDVAAATRAYQGPRHNSATHRSEQHAPEGVQSSLWWTRGESNP